jgi:uncharacterized phiE125 gp8 family phage protein
MPFKTTVSPAVEPVTLAEVKLQLKIETADTADDTLISNLIKAVRAYAEGYLNRAIIAQTIKLSLDEFPREIRLPLPPLHKVVSIRYKDTAGDWQTLASTVYDVDNQSEPGRIVLAYNQAWPGIRGDINGVEITINAGYAATFTADATLNVLTAVGRTYTDGDLVQLSNLGGALPTNLSVGVDYYVRDVSGYTFKLAATSGGTAIDFTTAGTGTHFIGVIPEHIREGIILAVNHFYEHRQIFSEDNLKEIPFAAITLWSLDMVDKI